MAEKLPTYSDGRQDERSFIIEFLKRETRKTMCIRTSAIDDAITFIEALPVAEQPA